MRDPKYSYEEIKESQVRPQEPAGEILLGAEEQLGALLPQFDENLYRQQLKLAAEGDFEALKAIHGYIKAGNIFNRQDTYSDLLFDRDLYVSGTRNEERKIGPSLPEDIKILVKTIINRTHILKEGKDGKISATRNLDADPKFMRSMAYCLENGVGIERTMLPYRDDGYCHTIDGRDHLDGKISRATDAFKEAAHEKFNLQAAKQGDASAMAELAKLSKYSDKERLNWLKKAVDAAKKENFDVVLDSIRWSRVASEKDQGSFYKILAKKGCAAAMVEHIKILEKAKSPDRKRIAKWHERAAEAGVPYSMYATGFHYKNAYVYNGDAKKADHATALKWFKKAVAAGSQNAIIELAHYYKNGIKGKDGKVIETTIDYAQALDLYRLAGKDNLATEMLGEISEPLKPRILQGTQTQMGAEEDRFKQEVVKLLNRKLPLDCKLPLGGRGFVVGGQLMKLITIEQHARNHGHEYFADKLAGIPGVRLANMVTKFEEKHPSKDALHIFPLSAKDKTGLEGVISDFVFDRENKSAHPAFRKSFVEKLNENRDKQQVAISQFSQTA